MAENLAAKVTKAFFEQQGLNSDLVGDSGEELVTGFKMKNCEPLMIRMIFDEGNTGVHLLALDYIKVPEERKERMYKIVNDMNTKFRWIKFCLWENSMVVTAEDDAVIQIDSCGDEVLRCAIQLASICDEAYPLIMKELFA